MGRKANEKAVTDMERIKDYSKVLGRVAGAGALAFGIYTFLPDQALASHCITSQIIEAPRNMDPVGLRYSNAVTGEILKEVAVQNGSRVEIDVHALSPDGRTYNNLKMQSRTDQEVINGFCFEKNIPRRVRLHETPREATATPSPRPTATQTVAARRETPTPAPEDRRVSETATSYVATTRARIMNLNSTLGSTLELLNTSHATATRITERLQAIEATNNHLRDVIGQERFYKVLLMAGVALAVLYALTRRYNPRPVVIRGRRVI